MARCKYGKLKNPVGRRRCKKAPKKGRRRKASGKSARSRKPCLKTNGKLKKGWRFGKRGRCVKAK